MRLPRTAVVGPVRPDSPMMNSAEADDVERRRAARVIAAVLLGGLNISSMRSVTRKPPTTLIVPNVTATVSSALVQRVRRRAGGEQHDAAEHDDPVDRVRPGHQRRVQGVGDLRDHGVADEAREHQRAEVGQEHQVIASAIALPRLTHAPDRTSSVEVEATAARRRSSARAAPARCARTAARRARARVAGRLRGAAIVTPSQRTTSARLGQLAVAAGLAGQVDDHAAGAHARDGLGADEPRRGAPGHQRGRDDDVEARRSPALSACCWAARSSSVSARA